MAQAAVACRTALADATALSRVPIDAREGGRVDVIGPLTAAHRRTVVRSEQPQGRLSW